MYCKCHSTAPLTSLCLRRFAKLGAKVILWDINREANEAVATEIRELSKIAHPYVVDCSKREEIYRVAEQVRKGHIVKLLGIDYIQK